MGDCDCNFGDCGNCDCDCGDCDCGDCGCEDCGCGDCECCGCCDGKGGGGGSWGCFEINCAACCADTGVNVASDVDHVANTYNQKRKKEHEKYLYENGEPLSTQPGSDPAPSAQSNGEPVMTQPGVDPNVVVSQPRGDPPPYDSVVNEL